jgi:hypothetical protein
MLGRIFTVEVGNDNKILSFPNVLLMLLASVASPASDVVVVLVLLKLSELSFLLQGL